MKRNRKTTCVLAGMDLDAFKQAQRIDPKTGLDDLLFLSHDGHGDDQGDDGRRRYARYTPNDVLLLACAVQLAAGGGYISKAMSFANAAKIMSNHVENARAAVALTQETKKLHFIGYATLHGSWGTGGENLFGTLSQIEERLHRAEPIEVENLYLIAPSTVLSQVFERAKQNGIEWDSSRIHDRN